MSGSSWSRRVSEAVHDRCCSVALGDAQEHMKPHVLVLRYGRSVLVLSRHELQVVEFAREVGKALFLTQARDLLRQRARRLVLISIIITITAIIIIIFIIYSQCQHHRPS